MYLSLVDPSYTDISTIVKLMYIEHKVDPISIDEHAENETSNRFDQYREHRE
jgi:hypothetical protein